MNIKLKLIRPIVCFDLETTGTKINEDRIVSIGVVKILPDGQVIEKERLVNPIIPIPKEATAIHKITNDDVKNERQFKTYCKGIQDFFSGCDIIGYNICKFDLPLLMEEFHRCGIEFPEEGTHVIDIMSIFHLFEGRTLADAVKFYCNEEFKESHNALKDAIAAIAVFVAQLERYRNLPLEVISLYNYLSQKNKYKYVDIAGYLVYIDNEICFRVGKHAGKSLKQVKASFPKFIDWVIKDSYYPRDAKRIVKKFFNL